MAALAYPQIFSNGTINPLGTGTRQLAVLGCSKWATNRASVPKTIICSAGVIATLRVVLTTPSGRGNSRTFTVFKNGSSTLLAVTLSGTSTNQANIIRTVSVVAGDYLQLVCEESGATASTYLRFTLEWTPTTAGETLLAGCVEATNIADTEQVSLAGSQDAAGAEFRLVLPCGGTIKNLHARLNGTVGSGSRTFTLYKTGSSTALTCTISSGSTGSDTGNTVSVVDGDTIYIHCTKSSFVNDRKVALAVTFVPDNINDFVIASTSADLLPKGGAGEEQKQFCTGDGIDGTIVTANQLFGRCRLKKIRVAVWVATGVTPPVGGTPASGLWRFELDDWAGEDHYVDIEHGDGHVGFHNFNKAYMLDSEAFLQVSHIDVPSDTENEAYSSVSFLASTAPDEGLAMMLGDF